MVVRRGRPSRQQDDFETGGNSEPQSSVETAGKEKPTDKKSKSLLDRFAFWTVLIVSLPFRFAASIAEQFVDRAGPGAKLLGAIAFILGAFLSADSYWQASGGGAIFPWFETNWNGWNFLFLFKVDAIAHLQTQTTCNDLQY
jgi:hypothetical protein